MSAGRSELRRRIAEEIFRWGPMPFSRYMEMCLYEPELGYYLGREEKFGKGGDFYTSSDVHAVFGRLLAIQFEEMWRVLGEPRRIEIVEMGAGRGLFARDVLDWLEAHFPACYDAAQYLLVEISSALRSKLQERLQEHLARGKAAISATLPSEPGPHPAIVFCNEFFDALPVELVGLEGEVRVTTNDDLERGGAGSPREKPQAAAALPFVRETFVPPSPALMQYLDRYSVLPESAERLEAGLMALQWVKTIAGAMREGFLVVIDYGYAREDQLRGRHRGTLACFRRHSMSGSPYEAPGEQDITSHVNFTALQAAAREAGMEPGGLVTQAQFLLGIGEGDEFASVFQHARLPQERAKMALQLKHLIAPEGMGESFQVLVMSKGIGDARRGELSGLKFHREAPAPRVAAPADE